MSRVIPVKYFDEKMPKLKKLKQGDWIDLSVRDIQVADYGLVNPIILDNEHGWDVYNGESTPMVIKVKFGIAMELPSGKEAHIVPRGSTFKNYLMTLANNVGIVDNSFCGPDDEWWGNFVVHGSFEMEKYARVAQFKIVDKMPHYDFLTVDELHGDNRGSEGSTGL